MFVKGKTISLDMYIWFVIDEERERGLEIFGRDIILVGYNIT
jgi:hypothetical protein